MFVTSKVDEKRRFQELMDEQIYIQISVWFMHTLTLKLYYNILLEQNEKLSFDFIQFRSFWFTGCEYKYRIIVHINSIYLQSIIGLSKS